MDYMIISPDNTRTRYSTYDVALNMLKSAPVGTILVEVIASVEITVVLKNPPMGETEKKEITELDEDGCTRWYTHEGNLYPDNSGEWIEWDGNNFGFNRTTPVGVGWDTIVHVLTKRERDNEEYFDIEARAGTYDWRKWPENEDGVLSSIVAFKIVRDNVKSYLTDRF